MKNLVLIMLFSTFALRAAAPASLKENRAMIAAQLELVKKEQSAIGIKAMLAPLLRDYTPPEATEDQRVYIKALVTAMRTQAPFEYAGLVLPHTWADTCGVPKTKFLLVTRKVCLPALADALPESPTKELAKLQIKKLGTTHAEDMEATLRVLQVISTSPINFEEND